MEKNMTEGRPFGILCRFAFPLMIGNAFQLCYTIADGAVVGRLLGVEAFAAVGAAGFLYWLIMSIILGLSQGFGTVLAHRYGAGDLLALKKTYAAALLLTVCIGGFFSLLMPFVAEPMLRALNTPIEILPDTARYLAVLFGGLFITFFYNTFAAAFRALGDSKTPLYALLIASILNVLLDIALVRMTPLGVQGVALATVLAQGIACVYCALRLRRVAILRLRAPDWRGLLPHGKELMRIGGPTGLRNAISSFGGVVLQYFANGYGTAFIAGITAAGKLSGLLGIVGGAFDAAVATFVAQNYGARKLERVKAGVNCTRVIMLAGAAAMMVLLFPLGRYLLYWFLPAGTVGAQAALDVAVRQLRVALAFLPLLYMLYLYRSSLQGIGRPLVPMLSGFIELIMRVATLVLVTRWAQEWGVYLAEASGWTVAAICLYLAYRRAMRENSAVASIPQ